MWINMMYASTAVLTVCPVMARQRLTVCRASQTSKLTFLTSLLLSNDLLLFLFYFTLMYIYLLLTSL